MVLCSNIITKSLSSHTNVFLRGFSGSCLLRRTEQFACSTKLDQSTSCSSKYNTAHINVVKAVERARLFAVECSMSSLWPKHSGPTAEACMAVCDALAQLHGRPSNQRDKPREGCEIQVPHTVLDSLVRTILSQNTTDTTSQRAFSALKAAFPDWEQVRTARPGAVEDAIRVGGLADIKAARIKTILNSLLEERGSLSLEHLRELPVDQIKTQLSKYKGVGPKTIACVLMFCLGRAEFPVDAHVWEISKQLGWVPAKATREQTYEHLNQIVPNHIKYDLHVLMVQHGKVCPACGKRGAAQKRKALGAEPCPIASFKRSRGAAQAASACIDSNTVGEGSCDSMRAFKRQKAEGRAAAQTGGQASRAAEAIGIAAAVADVEGSGDQDSKPAAAASAAGAGGREGKMRGRQQLAQVQHDLLNTDPLVAIKEEPGVNRGPAGQQAGQHTGLDAAVVKQEGM